MYKKMCFILLCSMILLLSACASTNTISNDTAMPDTASPSTWTWSQFNSLDELADFAISDRADEFGGERLMTTLFPTTEIIERFLNAEFVRGFIRGDWVNYSFKVRDVDLEPYMQRADFIVFDDYDFEELMDILDEGMFVDEDMLRAYVEYVNISVNISGLARVQGFVSMNPMGH